MKIEINIKMNRKAMRSGFFVLVLLMMLDFSNAQDIFDGPIRFKGIVTEDQFVGRRFNIKLNDGKFVLSQKGEDGKFSIDSTGRNLHDVAISSNGDFAVFLLNGRDLRSPSMSLVVVSVSGEVNRIDYKLHHMSEDYGWIVEVGSVSNNGKRVLAKCAKLITVGEGRRIANHDWVVLSIVDDSLTVEKLDEVFDKWSEYSGKGK